MPPADPTLADRLRLATGPSRELAVALVEWRDKHGA